MQQIFSAPKVFTGDSWLNDHAIVTDNGVIEKVIPATEADAEHFDDCIIVPAFIDVQVYGAAGKLFSFFPEPQTLQLMQDVFLKEGTVVFLPTLATNTIEVFKKAIDAVRNYWHQGGTGVCGLHLEGPWLNEQKRGAHISEWIHEPSVEEVSGLLDYGKQVIKMITVAPEVCSDEVIELMRAHNIIIAAGHSNATYLQAKNGFKKGIQSVTHLYNAMSPLHHREPGLTGAAMYDDRVMASIIPDGHHVDYAAIGIAKKLMGERLFAITDAVTETSEGPYRHQQAGDKYECNGVLSGSALSMHQAFFNLVNFAGIEVEEALRMCSLYPAQLMGFGNKYGKIAPGYSGQFLVLNKQLALACVIDVTGFNGFLDTGTG